MQARFDQVTPVARVSLEAGLAAGETVLPQAERVMAAEHCKELLQVVAAQRNAFREHDAILDAPSFNPFIFLPPALCDMTATSIQYIGLTLTYASSFQMLRGKNIFEKQLEHRYRPWWPA